MTNVYSELRNREKQNQQSFKQEIGEMEEKIDYQNELAQDNIKTLVNTQKELNQLKSECETLQAKIDISQSINSYHESCNYKQRINDLKKAIETSRIKGHEVENEIAN